MKLYEVEVLYKGAQETWEIEAQSEEEARRRASSKGAHVLRIKDTLFRSAS